MAGESTQERIVRVASDMFHRQGFQQTAIDQIVDAASSTKTTFYNYFESKEDLALACLRQQDARWRKDFPTMVRDAGGDDPIAQLRAIWSVWQEWVTQSTYSGCLCVKACSEYPDPRHPCHRTASQTSLGKLELLRDLATRAGAEDPELFAKEYLILMHGAAAVTITTNAHDTLRVSARLAELLIASTFGDKTRTSVPQSAN